MNRLLVMIALFTTTKAFGTSTTELSLGSITTHFIAPNGVGSRFENKLNESGIIMNPLYGIRYGNKWKGTFFLGDNSVGTPMVGLIMGRYTKVNFLEIGVSAGFYLQSVKEFEAREIETGGFVNNIMPVIGLELNPILYRGRGFFVKLNNMITPILSNHSIGIGFDFEPLKR